MKKRVKILILPALACCLATAAAQRCEAQNIETFRHRLAQTEVVGEGGATARVHVTERADAAAAVARVTRGTGDETTSFQGYRVGLYSGNDQTAQESSLAAKVRFEEAFDDINVYLVYDNPYFKVTAGDCLTEEEAVMLLARVRRVFPKAYIVRAVMTLDDIVIREHDGADDEQPQEAE